ncbi:hypothetical protein LOTGIDRAFT_114576, partial [Lottia gigantea]
EWGTLFPEATGSCQSPVNLVSQDAVTDSDLEKNSLMFNYCISRETDILNNGHTLAVFPRVKHVLTGGPLLPDNEYELAEIRFHWGRDNTRGSEHTVNGKAFPMEVQIVHWNATKYSSIEEALGSPHGIVIVSLFTQIGREHTALRVITDNLEDVLYKGRQKTVTSAFNPTCLLPDPLLRDYWTYEGSVTSPPCSENVQWILLRYPLMVSHAQIEEFRRLRTFSKGDNPKTGDDGAMVDNFRPTQPLNDRKVKASFQY